jgi:hypothetical protein
MTRFSSSFACLVSACLALTTTTYAMTEPASKIKFEDTLTLPGTASSLSLAGVGVRVKKLVGPLAVKVYGVGLYVDEKAVGKRLSKFKGHKTGSKALFDALEADTTFDKIVLLKMARKVGAATLVNALAESVKPRLGKGSDAALLQFQDVLLAGLKGGEAETGKQFGFGIQGGNKLIVTINGKKQGEIASGPLAQAMLKTYLDDNAVSKDMKDSVAQGILTWINLTK